jgi:hypothetical protein
MARAGINWARGLDELGSGLLRQVDIGGRAYEDAAKKEAERRAESRQMAAERRALTAQEDAEARDWQRKQDLFGMESERWVDQQKLLHGFRSEESEIEFERLKKLDEIRYGRDEASKLAAERRARYDKINDLIMAAKSEKAILAIQNNVKRAESADDSAENYGKMLAKAVADGNQEETDRLARELEKAELQRTEAWARIPGVEPLTSRQPSQFKVFSILGNEIADKISLQIGDKLYVKTLLAIKDGKKDSKDYQAAVDTIDAALKKIYETNPVLNNYSNTKKRDLRKYLIEKTFSSRSQGVTKEDEKRTAEGKVVDGGNGNLEKEFLGESQKDIVDQIDVDNISKDDIGLYQREFTKYQDHGHPQLQAARVRDPSVLLPLLRKERSNMIGEKEAAAGYGMAWPEDKIKRLAKVEQIIAKLEALDPSLIDRYERDDFGNILRDKTPGVPSAALPAPQSDMQVAGMVNPRGGMIFEADQMNMAPAAVNARYA